MFRPLLALAGLLAIVIIALPATGTSFGPEGKARRAGASTDTGRRPPPSAPGAMRSVALTRVLRFRYRSYDGRTRGALVALPLHIPPGAPALPLVIAPHGRGVSARYSLAAWGDLPGAGGFAIVAPDGQGRQLSLLSWGYAGQIEDLARMPRLVARAFPWLTIDTHRVYAIGGSMGGQEALLVAARYPHLLAGVAAFDSVTDLALQYRNFPRIPCNAVCLHMWRDPIGVGLQGLARVEVGGSPDRVPKEYARRSPIAFASALAFSHIPIELWWSRDDEIVQDGSKQSGRLFWRIRRLNPTAPIEEFVGWWRHSAEFRAQSRLPFALAEFGLMPAGFDRRPRALQYVAPPASTWRARKTGEGGRASHGRTCRRLSIEPAYSRRVGRALAAGRDVWGGALLRSPGGPTYAGAAVYLKPLMLAGHPPGNRMKRLTDSGVYYLAFGEPSSGKGAEEVALHVADGSEIASERTDGARLTTYVGRKGREHYGSCLPRLVTPALYRGYLPILETEYVDAVGVRYRQESFAVRSPQTGSLVSFVRVTATARAAQAAAPKLRFEPSVTGLSVDRNRLVRAGKTYLFFSPGGVFDGSSLTYSSGGEAPQTIYVVWPTRPTRSGPLLLGRATYESARRSLIDYWTGRLAKGTTFVVPERRVLDAERSLLIQNLTMTWRYSLGNAYQEFEFPESLDAADVLGEYGFTDIEKAIDETALRQPLALYPNWQMGAELIGIARYYRLSRDSAYLAEVTPTLRRYISVLRRQLDTSPNQLLKRERYASDLPDLVYGLNGQAVVLHGLRAIANVWSETGHSSAAAASRRLAVRLTAGLRAAVSKSTRRLPDHSLFVPVKLLDDSAPYEELTASRPGSYWNLVMPYALASGLFEPRRAQARGIWLYMLNHGSRFLGLVRAGAASLYTYPKFPTSGSDQVYGLDVARFLADNDQADQLVLSLYGQLAAGMTHGTFVSGESATIAPAPGEFYRSMYLPPNSVSNATFLETLRLTLIHETETPAGRPDGLQLAYATPRSWLTPGKRIVVSDAPTSFGPISFSLTSTPGSVHASVDVPTETRPRTLELRLRLPRGTRIANVKLDGRLYSRFENQSNTIDLSGESGTLDLTVRTRST